MKVPKQRKTKICGYSECKKPFVPQRDMQPVCSVSCAIKYNEEKEIAKRLREYESNVTKLSVYEGLARTVFQTWIRLRDKHLPCISCGTFTTNQWDSGHFKKAELFSGVIFNPLNVNKQCCYCNGPKMHGNLLEYRKGLVLKIGEDKVNELEVLADQTRQYKFTRDELAEITTKYKKKIKDGDFTNS